jgi:hypothetical protein
MKEMDSLENRLRSCPPRRPSANLKRRLFAAPARLLPKVAWLLGSLAPATACVLLTFSAFSPGNPGSLLRREPLMAVILSNQNYAAYASDNFRGSQNSLFSVTFDWTNHGGFPSSMAPFSPSK